MNKPRIFDLEKLPSWLPIVLAWLGAVLYLIQAIGYAHSTIPGLDEGSYLLKGILYMRGVYEPFEPYGPLTNKAPFAFLIPGFAEWLFGAGIRTGRYFAIFLGLLTLLGVWITARRWAGKWMAAATVWIFAISPMIIKIHAITASEVIIASILAWICVLILGEDRPLWQIILGAALSALTVLTRQNMVLILPLMVLYVFWQHGKQKGIWAFATGAVVFLTVHIYYWPHILVIWAPWLPDSLTPFLDPFRLPKDAIPVWDPSLDFWNRLNSFFQGVRFHFVPVVGSLFSLLLWVRPRDWKSFSAFRAAVFLFVLYFILFAMHAWAAVASQYESYSCVYCFTPYLTFFDPLGILLTVIAFTYAWNTRPSRWVQFISVIFVLVLAIGIGYSLFDWVGTSLMELPVPRMRDGQFLPGTTRLMDFLTNKFGFTTPWVKRTISAALGLVAGVAILLAAYLFRQRSRYAEAAPRYAHILLNLSLALGILLAPLFNMGSGRDCEEDIIANNEAIGHHLAEVIPPDSLVYWEGGLSFTPMTYVLDVRIFPPQINDGYTYRIGGDPDTLYRFSHWNSELDQEWMASADIFIVEERRYSNMKPFLDPAEFGEFQRPPVAPSCKDGAGLRIFYRLP